MALPPTIGGFISFIQNVMGIKPQYLPPGAPVIQAAFDVAMAVVNPSFALVPVGTAGDSIYSLAVYNLAGDNLINFAPDQEGFTYFQDLRTSFGCNSFRAGVVQTGGDEGTQAAIIPPEWAQMLTMADLQYIKTPYGRQYMSFAQRFGTLWGSS